jgi:peptide-methionine (S)-S-oxide reductase
MAVPATHFVNGAPLDAELMGMQRAMFAMGCFWGAERKFWQAPGVISTAVGYAGGFTPNPSYEEVCSGLTGHAEVVRAIFDPEHTSYAALLALFWENHDPTQGMRQGNDVGTQYRSAIYTTTPEQSEVAAELRATYQAELQRKGITEPITTEIKPAPPYYYAEDHHQQYLAKNPYGYRCHANTGVPFPSTTE